MTTAATMNDPLRDAAFRAGLWQTIEQRAKELKDAAKSELAQGLESGDSVAGKWDGRTIAKATMTKGRSKLAVTDERAFVDWVAGQYPTEIVSHVNPAFVKQLEIHAKGLGAAVDVVGEPIPGVELLEGDAYVSVRRDPEAPFIVAQLLSAGRISLDGVKELEAK